MSEQVETTPEAVQEVQRIYDSEGKEQAERTAATLNSARTPNAKTGKLPVANKVYKVDATKDIEAGHNLYIVARSPGHAMSLAAVEFGIGPERVDAPVVKPSPKEYLEMIDDTELDELCDLLSSKRQAA